MIEGYGAVQARMRAIAPSRVGMPMMTLLGATAVREQKLLVRRKTGNLGRTIHVGIVTPTSVETVASASYAGDVEFGTKPHLIRPRNGRVLAWAATSGTRLTGSARRGAAMIFARLVHHPGTRPYPFMKPGAQKAIASAGLLGVIVAAWDRAA